MKKDKKKTPNKKVPKKVAPEPPKSVEVRIIGDMPNPMWKRGLLKNGTGCKVQVPKRWSDKLGRKSIECDRVDENGETYYKYNP